MQKMDVRKRRTPKRRRRTVDSDSDVGRVCSETGDGSDAAGGLAVICRRDYELVGPQDGLMDHQPQAHGDPGLQGTSPRAP